ncbi:MAG: phosphatase PAP2 family protein [Dehalococcoidia bacterium]
MRIGVQIWIAGALLFALLAAAAAIFDRFPGDERSARAVQDIDVPAFGGFVDTINWLGGTWPLAALIVMLAGAFLLRRAPLAAGLVLLTFVARWLNSALQELIGRPRPSPDLIDVTKQIDAGSFPSGHTVALSVLFGLLFFLAPALVPWPLGRWALRAVCLLVIAAAGPARVYIGVHWPSDVFGGYLLALLFLAPVISLYVELFRRENVDSRA